MSAFIGANESLVIMLAPISSNNLPVGMRDERPAFLILEFESNSVRNASYLLLSSEAYGNVTICSLSKPSDLFCMYLIWLKTMAVQIMRIIEIANCIVTNTLRKEIFPP